MRNYRLVLLLKSDLKKEKKQKLLEDIKKWVGKAGKVVEKELGESKLSYTIKGEKKGEYVMMEFEAETIVNDAEKRIMMQEEVIRHLLVRTK